jgi:hypothetical protein
VWQGKPVRKCVQCGAGMTVGFPKRISLIEPGLWARMEASWAGELGGEGEEENEYPIVSCPYCGNTGSTEPGSAAFEYRVTLSEPTARMCRQCERGFWMHPESGGTEQMSVETWAGLETMHATLGGGAKVDAELARRAAPPGPDDESGGCEAGPAHPRSET